MAHKSISNIILNNTIIIVVHHNDLIPNTTELDGVSNVKLVALTWLEVVILVVAHVSHDQP